MLRLVLQGEGQAESACATDAWGDTSGKNLQQGVSWKGGGEGEGEGGEES